MALRNQMVNSQVTFFRCEVTSLKTNCVCKKGKVLEHSSAVTLVLTRTGPGNVLGETVFGDGRACPLNPFWS